MYFKNSYPRCVNSFLNRPNKLYLGGKLNESHLGFFLFNRVEDVTISGFTKSTFISSKFILLKSGAHAFWAIWHMSVDILQRSIISHP